MVEKNRIILLVCVLVAFIVIGLLSFSYNGFGMLQLRKPTFVSNEKSSDFKTSPSPSPELKDNKNSVQKIPQKKIFIFKNPFSVYETTNKDQGLTFFKEKETDDKIIATQLGKYVVLVPQGFEEF